MPQQTDQAKPVQPRRGATDYSTILNETRRKQFNIANRLRTRLIEIDVNGDSVREEDLLKEVCQAVRDVLAEFVEVGGEDGVRMNRSLGRLRLVGRVMEKVDD